MDRRSFDLNYENNILLWDPALTAEMRARQDAYIADSRLVTLDEVDTWTWRQRLWSNALATLSPVLKAALSEIVALVGSWSAATTG